MNVGYVDEDEHFFCASCWSDEVTAGRRSLRVLDDEETDGPGDNFWLVDECSSCARPITHMEAKLLT